MAPLKDSIHLHLSRYLPYATTYCGSNFCPDFCRFAIDEVCVDVGLRHKQCAFCFLQYICQIYRILPQLWICESVKFGSRAALDAFKAVNGAIYARRYVVLLMGELNYFRPELIDGGFYEESHANFGILWRRLSMLGDNFEISAAHLVLIERLPDLHHSSVQLHEIHLLSLKSLSLVESSILPQLIRSDECGSQADESSQRRDPFANAFTGMLLSRGSAPRRLADKCGGKSGENDSTQNGEKNELEPELPRPVRLIQYSSSPQPRISLP
jgi:hypothetical protein